MKAWLTFFGILVVSFCDAQQSMTLDQCIQTAWQNNLQMKQAELSVESGEANLKAAQTNILPNLNGFATHNYNWGQRIDPFTNQFATSRVQSNSFGVSSSVDLFNGFQNQQNIKVREAALESVQFDLETQKNNIALNVAAAFLAVVMTEELIGVSDQQVVITKQQLDRVIKLVEAGSLNAGARYDLEAQLARDEAQRVQRQNDYQMAMLQLKQMLILPADESISLEKPSNLDLESKETLENAATVYAFAESNMPEIKSAQMSLLQWDSQMKSAQSGRYPSLSLSGSIGTGYSGLRSRIVSVTPNGADEIGYTSANDIVYIPSYETQVERVPFGTQLGDNFNQFIGLSLNVPVFNRGSVSNSVKQAKINRSLAELQLEQEKIGLRQKIESARVDAIAAKETYRSNQASLSAAAKAFEFAKARFEAGALNATEFNTSKGNLELANNAVTRSKYDYIFKSKILDFYLGKSLGF
jgi:outer membrane protein